MIPFDEALNIVLSFARVLPDEIIHISEADNRVLSQHIFSDIDMPPFNKSAVDGFACKKDDLAAGMRIIETIPAGTAPSLPVGNGEASKIMTGSMIPKGADFVFMVEDSVTEEGKTVKFTGAASSNNICVRGEDIRKGDLILMKGTRIASMHIACLAAVGAVNIRVFRKPRTGILSTGNELVEPDVFPTGAKIRNSNALQLVSQVREAGAIPDYGGIAEDTEDSLERMITKSLEKNDIVILTGGVSMGDFDHVPSVMEKLGFDIHVRSVAIQPGKPTVFATKENKAIFGLPGNPVSSFVLFEMLVKPFIKRMSEEISVTNNLRLETGADFKRKKSERLGVIPVEISKGKVWPVEYHGSAHINAYSSANGMAFMMPGIKEISKGEEIDVRPI